MSTKYTREQIDKARQLADHAFDETAHRNRQHDGDIVAGAMRRPADEWIDVFTEALGLDVEDEKPEPGTWHWVDDVGAYANQRAYVTGYGSLMLFADNGDYDVLIDQEPWPTLCPEPRVVSAEPVELTEEEVGEIYEAESRNYHWDDLPTSGSGMRPKDMQQDITLTVNAAIAKHGHGRAEVEREWLRAGIAELRGNGYGLNGEVIDIITDAVMELLEASK